MTDRTYIISLSLNYVVHPELRQRISYEQFVRAMPASLARTLAISDVGATNNKSESRKQTEDAKVALSTYIHSPPSVTEELMVVGGSTSRGDATHTWVKGWTKDWDSLKTKEEDGNINHCEKIFTSLTQNSRKENLNRIGSGM